MIFRLNAPLSRHLLPALLCTVLLPAGPASADSFRLSLDTDLIGDFRTTQASHKDTLLDIARGHGLGYNEIKLANSQVDTWLPGEGQEVALPKRYVLPDTPREGIVLNIPEMRLYYYKQSGDEQEVLTYPLGVGREGWQTPYATTRITAMVKDPAWYPPESIRKEHAEQGDPLPRVVPAGPDNPLGRHAMRLDLPSYLIHGTNKPWGVGMRVSHGCIRLYPEHVETLFSHVDVGTTVRIINQPYKVGRENGLIYLEAHPYLDEDAEQFADSFDLVAGMIGKHAGAGFHVDWDLVAEVLDESQGVPVAVGMRLPSMPAPVAEPELAQSSSDQSPDDAGMH